MIKWIGVLALFAVSTAQAGAWLQDPGRAYVRVSGGLLETDRRYNADGDKVPFDDFGGYRRTTYRDLEGIIYAEAGVHPRFTLLTTAIFKSLQAGQESSEYNTRGLADVMVGARTKLWKGLWHVGAVSAEWWLPTGYDETLYPSLGSGSGEVRLGVHAGASGGKIWANVDAQFGLREAPFRDRLALLFSGGYSLSSHLAVRGSAGLVSPQGSVRTTAADTFDPTAVDRRSVELSGTLSWKLGQWALEGEVRGPVSGENTLAATRFGVAVATASSVRLWGRDPVPGPWGTLP